MEPHDHRYLTAFHTLNRARQHGMAGVQPLQLTEIEAFLGIASITEPQKRLRYAQLIQEMDAVFLDHMAERAEAAKAKAK